MKDVILMTPYKSKILEDNNSPRGPKLSAGSSSSQTSSNRSSPANSNDSSGKHGNHEVINSYDTKCSLSSKPPVSTHALFFYSRFGIWKINQILCALTNYTLSSYACIKIMKFLSVICYILVYGSQFFVLSCNNHFQPLI